MAFSEVRFYNFRNIENCKIDLQGKDIILIGNNGQGKSNFLESIYILSYGSSFRTKKDIHIIKNGNNEFSIQAIYNQQNIEYKIQVQIKDTKKVIKIDDKLVQDRSEIFGLIPCIVFCHEDIQFITQGPEFQRQYINQCGTLWFSEYIEILRNYTKILKERNFVLKNQQFELLSIYTDQLITQGILLVNLRTKIVELIDNYLKQNISTINKDLEGLSIEYKKSWSSVDLGEIKEHFKKLSLVEKKYGTTLLGPHRDKFLFKWNSQDFTQLGSTGQTRALSLALRLIQAIILEQETDKFPILLLDDVLLELDPEKRKNFMDVLPKKGQRIFTFLPNMELENLNISSFQILELNGGVINERNE